MVLQAGNCQGIAFPVWEQPHSRATCAEGQGATSCQGLEWTERKNMMPFIIPFLLARNWEEGICYTKKFSTFSSF